MLKATPKWPAAASLGVLLALLALTWYVLPHTPAEVGQPGAASLPATMASATGPSRGVAQSAPAPMAPVETLSDDFSDVKLNPPWITSSALSADGRTLLAARNVLTDANHYDLVAINTSTGQPRRRIDLPGTVVLRVAVSPDGALGVTNQRPLPMQAGARPFNLVLWDLKEGRELHRLNGHTGAITAIVFSSDGSMVVTASDDHSVRVWDTAKGEERVRFREPTAHVAAVAISPDGKLAIVGGARLQVYDVATGACLRTLSGHMGPINAVGFSPDGRWALSASDDRTIRIWDVTTGEHLRCLTGNLRGVGLAIFTPDGRHIISSEVSDYGEASPDRAPKLRVWEVAGGKQIAALPMMVGGATGLQVSATEWVILATTHFYSIRTFEGAPLRSPPGLVPLVLKPMPVGHAPVGEVVALPQDNWGQIVRFCSGDKEAWTAAGNGQVVRWDLLSGKAIERLSLSQAGNGSMTHFLDFSADGRMLLRANSDAGSVDLIRLADQKVVQTLRFPAGTVYGGKFSADGRRIITGHVDKIARVWDAGSGEKLQELIGQKTAVMAVAMSPDGLYAATGGTVDDAAIRIWDNRTGKQISLLEGPRSQICSLAFSPDGKRLLAGGMDGGVRLWDLATAQSLRQIPHRGLALAVAFSPDGLRALTCDYRLRLWDLTTGEELASFADHASSIRSVAFSADGRRALSVSDEAARLFDLPQAAATTQR